MMYIMKFRENQILASVRFRTAVTPNDKWSSENKKKKKTVYDMTVSVGSENNLYEKTRGDV